MNRLKTFIISILAIMATNISYAQTEQVKKVLFVITSTSQKPNGAKTGYFPISVGEAMVYALKGVK